MSASQKHETPVVRAIDQACVKFLTAGQKINDIETAIRELVENSIDAQAKNIEIRLTKNGIDAVEVDDNGTGIDEVNFQNLAHRYHTSKISDYQNFQDSLDTFGFRGEALSCLCSIANVTITTKTKTSPTGWKLIFKDGKLTKTERIGRDVGTTITLKNLFHSMPVRRRELETNAKRNYDKIVRILYEQVLARPHIKFSLCRKVASKKEKDFTYGGTTLKECLINIFGIKQLDSVSPIKQVGLEHGTNPVAKLIKVEPTILMEKSSPSNNDPCMNGDENLTGFVTSGNQTEEIDLMSNTDSTPTSNASVYDIDATDDTCRMNGSENNDQTPSTTVVLSNFTQSIAPSRDQIFFKRSRKSKYAREKPEFTIHGYVSKIGCGKNSTDYQYIFVNKKSCELPKVTKLINEIFKNYNNSNSYPFICLFIEVQRWAADFNVPRKREIILQEECKLCDIIRESLEEMYSASQKSCPVAPTPVVIGLPTKNNEQRPHTTQKKDDKIEPNPVTTEAYFLPAKSPGAQPKSRPATSNKLRSSGFEFECNDVVDSIPDLFEVAPKRARTSAQPPDCKTPLKDGANTGFKNGLDVLAEEIAASNGSGPRDRDDSSGTGSAQKSRMSALVVSRPKTKSPSPMKRTSHPPQPEPPCRFNQTAMMQDNDLKVSVDFLEDLPVLLERERRQLEIPSDDKEFSFAIHPKFNNPAEEELKLNLSKASFSNMQVIGQFNKGFIVARLNKHLFIIDQHATDERANFEDQLDKCPLVKQPMVHPKPLYLNLIQENAILNNMSAFIQRGFNFVVDQSKLVGYRVMLTSTSICCGPDRDEYLGKEDVEELIDVCIDSPNRLETYILSKIKSVSASIACRKSVMIGDPLTWSQMDKIVRKMSELKNPWVCAHNRPTIRHLMDTDWMDR